MPNEDLNIMILVSPLWDTFALHWASYEDPCMMVLHAPYMLKISYIFSSST